MSKKSIIIAVVVVVVGLAYYLQTQETTTTTPITNQDQTSIDQQVNNEGDEPQEQYTIPKNYPGTQPGIVGNGNSDSSTEVKDASYYCNTEPEFQVGALSGVPLYPSNPEYKTIGGWMSGIFTQDDCKEKNFERLFEVRDGLYWPGSRVTLRSEPSSGFLSVLQDIGFVKADSCISDPSESCMEWILVDEISIEDVLLIKPFLNEIEYNECVNCG